MFAESTALHEGALAALTADDRGFGLLDFEEHLLDRERPWAGAGGRTLTDLGYGYLGAYRRHVKDHINVLISFARHTCIPDPLETALLPRPSATASTTRECPGGRSSCSASPSCSPTPTTRNGPTITDIRR
jgi:hypothetical protein